MSRDGRGNPGRIVLKNNQPQLRLADVLRRRRTTLAAFIAELGITTYTSLEIWCKRMGVNSPTQAEFEVVFPPQVHINSPQEGVIVLDPPVIEDQRDDNIIDAMAPSSDEGKATFETGEEPTGEATKKARKKKVLPSD